MNPCSQKTYNRMLNVSFVISFIQICLGIYVVVTNV